MSQAHPAFELLRTQHVESLNLTVEEYTHTKTGAQHIHLSPQSSAGDEENVFLVALRTVPHDSRGVAHILEHTALCGSEKYPVRDPFFMMTRRSINTFMNAFTSSDWTAYPFSSLNKKDFNNLLDVYLDAVFFSRLDELDFAQEGHRLEFKEHDNPDSPLEYKGVVFNEMKGAMSSVPSQLWQAISKYLFPTTTYHYNSGGDPEDIPDLSYEQLLHFYKTHYHPSNAIFMTYGDISALDHQSKFEEQALKKFEKLDYTVSVPNEKRMYAPMRVEESYPCSDEDLSEKSHVVVGWLLGQSTDLRDSLRAQLLSSVLLDNSATPLMHVLESTDLGNAPSPLCGLDTSQKELSFMCGLADAKNGDTAEIEALVLSTLEQVAKDGIPAEDLESALHQLELHQREVGGDSYPYGLQLILTSLTNATHRGDPVGLLNIDAELEQLRQDVASPDFVKSLVKDLLLDNKHRVTLTLSPDSQIADLKDAAEVAKLAKIKAELSGDEKASIVERAKALKARQEQIDDESILPKVTLEDVPLKENAVDGTEHLFNGVSVKAYGAGTNGLAYQQVIYDLPRIDHQQLPYMSLYSSLITELGAGQYSYLDMQRQQANVSGSFSAFNAIRGKVDDNHACNAYFGFSGKALNRNQKALTELMAYTIDNARFDEVDRIRELVSQIRIHQEQSITGNGHALAMMAASSGICALSNFSHRLSGLAGIKSIKQLDNDINEPAKLAALAENFSNIHQSIISSSKQILLVSENDQLESQLNNIHLLSQSKAAESGDKFVLDKVDHRVQEAWVTNTQVNFCAKSYATVSMAHEDAAPLVVLAGFLRNGFLHTSIREQGGAYGGGASQDNDNAAFRFYSYRDPRLSETLDDFDKSIQWLLNSSHDKQKVEEAILGTMSSLDKSESPAGRAKKYFHADLHGRTLSHRQTFRERVLSTNLDDLRRVAQTYLLPEHANTAVITNAAMTSEVEGLSLKVVEL